MDYLIETRDPGFVVLHVLAVQDQAAPHAALPLDLFVGLV
jgi:hypothetical protein